MGEAVIQLTKIGIAGHERGLLFNRERCCKAAYVIELVLGINVGSLIPKEFIVLNTSRFRKIKKILTTCGILLPNGRLAV
jgi:hypothetical protein